MKTSIRPIKERVIDTLENLGWILGTENDLELVTYAFQKALCDQMLLLFNSVADDEITVTQYTYDVEKWPDHTFYPVSNNDNFKRCCVLKMVDAKGKDIEDDTLADYITKWLLIPEAEIPNVWDPEKSSKPAARSEETAFIKAQKRNAQRKAAKKKD